MEAASLAVNNEEAAAAAVEYEIASSAVDLMPPGFRFHPTDWEIIDYLLNKVIDRCFRAVAIGDIDLNNCEPWDLPKKAKMKGENEWFFYFEKITKYPSGMRTNRATPSGYWKATGRDKEIYNNSNNNNNNNKHKRRLVGMKKTLVFYKGRAPKGEKMNWVIHEYRLHGDFSAYNLSSDAKEKWVVCRVFHKKIGDPRAALQLGRVDSFVDRCLLDSPTPLPPLTDDDHGYGYDDDHFNFKPTASTSKLIKLQQFDQNNLVHPNLINQYSMNPNPYNSAQMVQLNSVQQQQQQHPYQSLPNMKTCILAADDIYIGGKERIMCKMEMAPELDCNKLESTNECDVDEEISLCFSPNVSLWSC